MYRLKLSVVVVFIAAFVFACAASKPKRYVIADSKTYEASVFRQNCAICHGPEAEGKVLDNGTKVPSLREGEFKFKTEGEIYNQIANGGNGMTPFRNQLTERELRMMAGFVIHDLRNK
jgi:mono/diheme cytochrome c family protein